MMTAVTHHAPHPAEGPVEHEVARAVGEYGDANGIDLRIAFGVWIPPEGFDAYCMASDLPEHLGDLSGRRAVMGVRLSPDQTTAGRSAQINPGCHDGRVLMGGELVEACRDAVDLAFRKWTAWRMRLSEIARHGYASTDPPPLWSLDIHPIVLAAAPDLASTFGLDPCAAKPTTDEGRDCRRMRIEGGRIAQVRMKLPDGTVIEQDSTGLHLMLEGRLPDTVISGLAGTPFRDIVGRDMPGPAGDMPVRAAIPAFGGTRVSFAPAWTPAAEGTGGNAWRDVRLPGHWANKRLPFHSNPS